MKRMDRASAADKTTGTTAVTSMIWQEKATRIYLIRHAETEENASGVLIGTTDSPLSDKGRKQAASLGRFMQGLAVDAVLTSPLQRAVETAHLVFENRAAITPESGLSECNFGAWEGLAFTEIMARYPEIWDMWLSDWARAPIPGAEDFELFSTRLIDCCEGIIKKYAGKSVALVSHGACIRILLSHYLCGQANTAYWKFKVENAALSELEFSGGVAMLTRFNQD